MFSFSCPQHGSDVMIWPSDIDDIVNSPDGIDMHFHCSCGFRAVLRTGAGHTERLLAASAA